MKIVSEVALISINGTLVVQLLSFLFFLWLINRLMIQPLRQVVDERRFYMLRIQEDTVAAEKAHQKLSREMAAHEAKVRGEGARVRDEEERAGTDEAGKLLAAAEAEIQRIRQAAEAANTRNIERVRSEMAGLAPELATAIMEKLLERRLAQ